MVRIAGVQGFYGDSPMGALDIAKAGAADYLVHDALAELTLSILQKDRLDNPSLGYARDIEFLASTLYPLALHKGIKIVTNSGGLNPLSAAQKVQGILSAKGIKGIKIAAITGDDLLGKLSEIQKEGESLSHLESGEPLSLSGTGGNTGTITHANVYAGAFSIAEALNKGAQIIFAGRVADPCLTLGILAHHYKWKIIPEYAAEELDQPDLDKLAAGITAGHILECGGQASGGNSYAEWPMDYKVSNLGYPIAHVNEDGSAIFTKLETTGGKISRNTIREQLVYEIHDPANYITPDVTVDLTGISLEENDFGKVSLKGVRGKPRPEKLKLALGKMEGFLSEQFFFFSYPYAYKKAQKFTEAVKEIWSRLPVKMERMEFSFVGINGIHGDAAPIPSMETLENINELGVRIAIKHNDEKTGKLAFQAIVALALNGPPGLISMPGWGKQNRMLLSLWPSLISRKWIKMDVRIFES
jgi:hypothetical protein